MLERECVSLFYNVFEIHAAETGLGKEYNLLLLWYSVKLTVSEQL
jgi:hypothetical protein